MKRAHFFISSDPLQNMFAELKDCSFASLTFKRLPAGNIFNVESSANVFRIVSTKCYAMNHVPV